MMEEVDDEALLSKGEEDKKGIHLAISTQRPIDLELNCFEDRGKEQEDEEQKSTDGSLGASVPSQQELADFIKTHHRNLRSAVREKESADDAMAVWKRHLENKLSLDRYASSMRTLATTYWSNDKKKSSRIYWCLARMKEYFFEGGKLSCIEKDGRRRAFKRNGAIEEEDAMSKKPKLRESVPIDSLAILDVGSSFNAFAKHGLNVTALDIAPAEKNVIKCDFLQCPLVSTVSTSSESFQLARASYDVVIFNFLLSYIPTTSLRLLCIVKALACLNVNGILIITTPDSKHVGRGARWMKDWKLGVEHLCCRRWRYEKTENFHGMVFRKVEAMDGVDGSCEHDGQCVFNHENVNACECCVKSASLLWRPSDNVFTDK
eukprot:m.26056 g.26056  ORF g.26056 m.26056 type:complete len:376 (-) comp5821_c0_seq2:892-2019(-)